MKLNMKKLAILCLSLMLAWIGVAAEMARVTITYEGYPYYRTGCELPTYKSRSVYILPTAVPQQEGKVFLGWQYNDKIYEPASTFYVPETDVVFVAVWDNEQGVETVNSERRATKFIRDGQLVIIRDGLEYNVLGEKL
jgi:hypothetical protein